MSLPKKCLLNLRIQKKKINPDNLICKYKTEKISSREFRDYQNPLKLSKDLTNGNINPKEVLKDQTNFESDLGKIKGNKKSKSKDQITVIRNVENFSNLREKIIDSFRDNPLLLSEAEYKAKQRRGLKIFTTKQKLQ